MKNSPKKIFLQMGLEETDSVEDFNMLERDFVTWESSQIYSDDLQFISVDFIFARIKELEAELNNEDSIYSEHSCRVRIDELENLIK